LEEKAMTECERTRMRRESDPSKKRGVGEATPQKHIL
jgi:hypothetical protein